VNDELSYALRRRARLFRRARIAVVALVIGYFFLPYGVQAVIPVWLLFLSALGLEVEFFLGGYLQLRRSQPIAPSPDRGPQPRDLADLGGEHWLEDDEPEEVPPLRLFPPDWYSAPPTRPAEPEAARHSYWRYIVEAVVAVTLVAGILFYASRPHGWDAVSAADKARAEAAFSREATLIAGHPARIGCDTSGKYVGFVQDADGLAFVGGSRAYLTPSICDTLYQVGFKHRVQSFSGAGHAIAVLGHESWHLHGVSNEGLTNCYAFQSGVQIGVHLGLSESTARAMMREQLATNAADAAGKPQYLVPAGCHKGGPDDLSPARPGFP
jgi:hypothetical protein